MHSTINARPSSDMDQGSTPAEFEGMSVVATACRPDVTTLGQELAGMEEFEALGESEQPIGGGESCLASLVRSAADGDQNAWNALVERFAGTVWAIARGYRLGAADAADVSQTTWLRLVEHLHRIEQPERVGAWLATTTRREALRVLRMAGRQIPSGEDLDVLPDPTPTRGVDDRLLAGEEERLMSGLVNDLVEQLPTRSRLLLRLLSADSPLSYKEISEALSMPIGSIGPTRARALEQLRKIALRAGVKVEDVFA